MRWTCDTARAEYEALQAQLAELAESIRKQDARDAEVQAIQLELAALRLIGTHTLPTAGSYGA